MMTPMIVYKLDYKFEDYYVDVFTGELYTPERVQDGGFTVMSKDDAFKTADEYLKKVRNCE